MDYSNFNVEERYASVIKKGLPPGVKLVRALSGFSGGTGEFAWSPDGHIFAAPLSSQTIRICDATTGDSLYNLKGHKSGIKFVTFDQKGRTLASGSRDGTIKLWNVVNGKLLHTLHVQTSNLLPTNRIVLSQKGSIHKRTLIKLVDSSPEAFELCSIAFDPTGRMLASAEASGAVKLWDVAKGKLIDTLIQHSSSALVVAFDPTGQVLASADASGMIVLCHASRGKMLHLLAAHKSPVFRVAFDSSGRTLASAGADKTVMLWDAINGRLMRTLEGHTDFVSGLAFLSDQRILASLSRDDTIRLWNCKTGACLGIIPTLSLPFRLSGLTSHPQQPLLAATTFNPGQASLEGDRILNIWKLDTAALLGRAAVPPVTYTSAKVVLVGDSGVGKTGLGWRLAHGDFKEHSSTHGQQFWLLDQLRQRRRDGAQCEAVLWDLAGQPDYRLIHALFLDDADLALVLFDPTRNDDPLRGVEFWLKQLQVGRESACATVLVAARSDRGDARLTLEELKAFASKRGLADYLSTSAMSGEGIDELVRLMQGLIQWEEKPATVTTETFKRIKDYVLDLKENRRRRKVILTPNELRERLSKTDRKWKITDAEMLTAVGHIANHGYVTRLETSRGEPRILLAPELLNNLAASFVVEARRNLKGLGALEEQRLLSDGYAFSELEKLNKTEREILLDSATVLFLEHNVCFRETDPLNGQAYLVFPELINLKRPPVDDTISIEDGVAYTVSGAVENVYASLVVLLGYTHTFTRTYQWQHHARYEVGAEFVCGFRREAERDGELDFVLYFGTNAPTSIRTLFQSLFESFLARRNLTVMRLEPVECSNGHPLNRAVVREHLATGKSFAFCNHCGKRIKFPKADKPIQLTKKEEAEVIAQRLAADQRSRFEQVLFRLKSYVIERRIAAPECFISYAWGNRKHELWVEKSLAADLQKAGVLVVLDRWENARIGVSVPRFVERVGKCDRVVVAGTPLYRKKYDNKESMSGFVLAAEGDIIGKRMMGTEAQKESVLPILLEGDEESSFPVLLQGRVYADFREGEKYFEKTLDLILSIYRINPQDPVTTELHESLDGTRSG